MSINNKKSLLLISDNRPANNWGCRSTSISLIHLLELSGFHVETLSELLGRRDHGVPLPLARFISGDKAKIVRHGISFIKRNYPVFSFLPTFDIRNVDLLKAAKRFYRQAECDKDGFASKIFNVLKQYDAIVVNGEGNAIFTNPPRPALLFELLMIQIGKDLGKPIHWVNGMFSPCPIYGINQPTLTAFREATRDIELVSLRDIRSFDLAKEKEMVPKKLRYYPDALFSLAGHDEYLPSSDETLKSILLRTGPSEPRIALEDQFKDHGFIAVSGASYPPGAKRQGWSEWFELLVTSLQKLGRQVVLLAPCSGDRFLESIAHKLQCYYVSPETNIFVGMALLSRAAVFVSGRWHPSIMASLSGTPIVPLIANSHKMEALMDMLNLKLIPTPIARNRADIDHIVKSVFLTLQDEHSIRKAIYIKANELGNKVSQLGQEIAES